MAYVKGCEFIVFSNYVMKKVEQGKIVMDEGLTEQLSAESLRQIVSTATSGMIDAYGKEDKGHQAGIAYGIMKKVNKQRILLGVAMVKRIKGEPSGKTGVAAWFEDSTDTYEMALRYFAPGYDREEEYFDECVIDHLKEAVSFGQVKEAEYLDKMVLRTEQKNILGYNITRVAFFILMFVAWGLIFNNFGVGLCFAFIFMTSFTMVIPKSKAKAMEASMENSNGEEGL